MGSYTSGYHAAMKDKIDRHLTEQPEYLALCYQYMKSLQAGAFDSELVNALFQEWERHTINLYDAYLFSQVWTGLYNGEILWTSIEIGMEPLKNSEREHNNMMLQSLLSKSWIQRHPIRNVTKSTNVKLHGRFWGGNDIGDGYLEWDQPLAVGVISPVYGEIEFDAPPTRAPLEVGYTSISTTVYHLNLERSLARWPYNSTSIYIFYCTEQWPDIDASFNRT